MKYFSAYKDCILAAFFFILLTPATAKSDHPYLTDNHLNIVKHYLHLVDKRDNQQIVTLFTSNATIRFDQLPPVSPANFYQEFVNTNSKAQTKLNNIFVGKINENHTIADFCLILTLAANHKIIHKRFLDLFEFSSDNKISKLHIFTAGTCANHS